MEPNKTLNFVLNDFKTHQSEKIKGIEERKDTVANFPLSISIKSLRNWKGEKNNTMKKNNILESKDTIKSNENKNKNYYENESKCNANPKKLFPKDFHVKACQNNPPEEVDNNSHNDISSENDEVPLPIINSYFKLPQKRNSNSIALENCNNNSLDDEENNINQNQIRSPTKYLNSKNFLDNNLKGSANSNYDKTEFELNFNLNTNSNSNKIIKDGMNHKKMGKSKKSPTNEDYFSSLTRSNNFMNFSNFKTFKELKIFKNFKASTKDNNTNASAQSNSYSNEQIKESTFNSKKNEIRQKSIVMKKDKLSSAFNCEQNQREEYLSYIKNLEDLKNNEVLQDKPIINEKSKKIIKKKLADEIRVPIHQKLFSQSPSISRCNSNSKNFDCNDKFSPKINFKSKMILRLEGIGDILYNDALRRKAKIECNKEDNFNQSHSISESVTNKFYLHSKFTKQFNETIRALNIKMNLINYEELKMFMIHMNLIALNSND